MMVAGLHIDKIISEFEPTRHIGNYQIRLEDIKRKALEFRERMLSGSPVEFYRSVSLIRVPYPTKFGFLNAKPLLSSPLLHILNRVFIVQYKNRGQLKTILLSPSDIDGNAKTPFFERLSQKMGPLKSILQPILAPRLSTVEEALASTGIKPVQVDYISYDHLHTQDLRKWLGCGGKPGYFPNAKLLVMKKEWESTKHLAPIEYDWYCPDGISGIDESKIILLEDDCFLGDGIAFIKTPGHTLGNHSFVVHTDEGLIVTSENGISADSYAPLNSRINSVRRAAQQSGLEVIMNGNTLESGLEQYFSMVLEKEIAGKSRRNPEFYNFVPSSEMTSYWAFPGLKPSFTFGEMEYGKPIMA